MGVCRICESDSLSVIHQGLRDDSENSVLRCASCGVGQLKKFPSLEQSNEFYNNNSQAVWVQPDVYVSKLRHKLADDTIRRANYIERFFKKEACIADIGTGYGFFVEEAKRRGFDVDGYEISRDRRAIAEQVTQSLIFDTNLLQPGATLKRRYDGIFLFQVLEHIDRPHDFIAILLDHLNPGGRLIIEVPNYGDWMVFTCEEYRNFYYQAAHLFYYNKLSLEKVFSQFSVDVEFSFLQRYTITNAFNWLLTGKPQIAHPNRKESDFVGLIHAGYVDLLEKNMATDTLIVMLTKP